MEAGILYDPLTLSILVCIGLVVGSALAFYALKRYELAIFLIMISPYVHWVFGEKSAGDLGGINEVSIISYARVGLVVFVGLIGVVTVIKSKFRNEVIFPKYFVCLYAFIAMILMSALYSVDQSYTLIRSFQFIALIYFVLGVIAWINTESKIETAFNVYFVVIVLGILINVFSLWIFPQVAWGASGVRFQGLTGHPNTFGAFCMVSYPIILYKFMRFNSRGKMILVLMLIVILVMHVLSGSRASMIASISGLFTWGIIVKNKALVASILIMVSVAGVLLTQVKPPSLGRENPDILHVTGRTELWLGCLQLISERPLLGYGFGVGGKVWEDPRFNSSTNYLFEGSARTSLHNGYLGLAIGGGLISLALLLGVIVVPLWKALKILPSGHKAFVFTIALPVLLLNLAESSLLVPISNSTIALWFAWGMSLKLPAIYNQQIIEVKG